MRAVAELAELDAAALAALANSPWERMQAEA